MLMLASAASAASANPITSISDNDLENSALMNFDSLPSGNANSYLMGAVTFKSMMSNNLTTQLHAN